MNVPDQSPTTGRELIIGPPGAVDQIAPAEDELVVEAIVDMFALINSPRPEHEPLREKLSELRWDAHRIAAQLDKAMHPQVAGSSFWADYAGWFSFFSVGPALATHEVIRQQIDQHRPRRARIIEDTRQASWWAGRSCIHPIAAHLLADSGIPFSASPGSVMRWLRESMLPTGATRLGRCDLNSELRQMADGAARSPQEVRPCDVVFVGAGASSAQIIHTLWRPLTETAGIDAAIVDYHWDNFTAAIARYKDVTTYDIGRFVTSADAIAARDRSAGWPTWFAHFVAHRDEVADFSTLDDGLKTAITQRLRAVLIRDSAAWDLRRIASERALDYLSPSAVVAFHPYTPNAASMIRAARERGIATVLLQHGIMGDWGYVLAAQPFHEAVVWGAYSAGIHSALLGPQTVITRTGHCGYDRIAQQHAEIPEPLAQLRSQHKALVLLATQPNEGQFFEAFETWWMKDVALACELLGAALVIKLHPADTNTALYSRLFKAHPKTVKVVEHGQFALPDLLAASDAMVTRDSTVVIEAGLLNIPAVTVNMSERRDWFPYAELGGAVAINRREEMLDILRDTLYNEDFRSELTARRERFLHDQVGKLDGGAAQRIAGVIARHVGRRAPSDEEQQSADTRDAEPTDQQEGEQGESELSE